MTDNDTIDAAIAAVNAIDLTEYRQASARHHKAEVAKRDADRAIAKAAAEHVAKLKWAVAMIVAPHSIVWRDYAETTINHKDWEIAPGLSCEVWPGFVGGYKMQARTYIDAHCTPRNAAELLQWAHCLKAAMDIIAAAHATEPAGVRP